MNSNFSGGNNDMYLNTDATSYSSKAAKNFSNYLSTSPTRFNLSNEFESFRKRDSLAIKIGRLKDFSKDMEYYINTSGNNFNESRNYKGSAARAQFSATLNALGRSLKSPRKSIRDNSLGSTQNLNSYSMKQLKSERSSGYIRPLVTAPNECSLTKTKIKREIDNLT